MVLKIGGGQIQLGCVLCNSQGWNQSGLGWLLQSSRNSEHLLWKAGIIILVPSGNHHGFNASYKIFFVEIVTVCGPQWAVLENHLRIQPTTKDFCYSNVSTTLMSSRELFDPGNIFLWVLQKEVSPQQQTFPKHNSNQNLISHIRVVWGLLEADTGIKPKLNN